VINVEEVGPHQHLSFQVSWQVSTQVFGFLVFFLPNFHYSTNLEQNSLFPFLPFCWTVRFWLPNGFAFQDTLEGLPDDLVFPHLGTASLHFSLTLNYAFAPFFREGYCTRRVVSLPGRNPKRVRTHQGFLHFSSTGAVLCVSLVLGPVYLSCRSQPTRLFVSVPCRYPLTTTYSPQVTMSPLLPSSPTGRPCFPLCYLSAYSPLICPKKAMNENPGVCGEHVCFLPSPVCSRIKAIPPSL